MEKSTLLVTDVSGCARCGGYHSNVAFRPFAQRNVVDDDGVVWDYWAYCTTTGDPLLLRSDLYKEMANDDGVPTKQD